MVINHANALHKCVTNRWTHKFEANVTQGFGHGLRFWRLCGYILAAAVDRRTARRKLPEVTSKIFHGQRDLRVIDHRAQFARMTNNAGIKQPLVQGGLIGICQLLHIKIEKALLHMRAFFQHRNPCQTSLHTL